MVHKRSGAQRRVAQQHSSRIEGQSASSQAKVPAAPATTARKVKAPALKPETSKIIAAVASLYLDQLKPLGRILRKRISERHAAATIVGEVTDDMLRDVDVEHLRATCESCGQLELVPEEGGDWSVTLTGCPSNFVDTSSPDGYPEELWTGAAAYFQNASPEEMTLPGGRYSCARSLFARELLFLKGSTLGQVCHIVQLAISERKLLGYLNGSVVAYGRSQSMMKEVCAEQKQKSAKTCQDAAGLPVVSWAQARDCLRRLLEEAATSRQDKGLGLLPISNVKALFRSKCMLELSETTLGHSKLSELLQDARFSDVCEIRLDGNGYSVVQCAPTPASISCFVEESNSYANESYTTDAGFLTEPLDLTDSCAFATTPVCFAPTPGPFAPTPRPLDGAAALTETEEFNYLLQMLPMYLMDAARIVAEKNHEGRHNFCQDEPLQLGGVECCADYGFAPTPSPGVPFFGSFPYGLGLSMPLDLPSRCGQELLPNIGDAPLLSSCLSEYLVS